MNKSRHVTFRCTQEQYDLIKKHSGDSLTKYLLSRIFYAMRKLDFEPDDPKMRYRDEILSKHHLDRERQLENRFKDKS